MRNKTNCTATWQNCSSVTGNLLLTRAVYETSWICCTNCAPGVYWPVRRINRRNNKAFLLALKSDQWELFREGPTLDLFHTLSSSKLFDNKRNQNNQKEMEGMKNLPLVNYRVRCFGTVKVAAPYCFCQLLNVSDCRHVVSMSGNFKSRVTFVSTRRWHCSLDLSCIFPMSCHLFIIITAFKSVKAKRLCKCPLKENSTGEIELFIACDALSGTAVAAALKLSSLFSYYPETQQLGRGGITVLRWFCCSLSTVNWLK